MSKRIDAVFVPEAWTNDYAVEIDGRRTEDVTKKILAMNLGDLHILEDNDDTSDGLVGTMDHTGPFRIEVTDSICEYFGVEDMKAITHKMVQDARQAEKVVAPEPSQMPSSRVQI